MERELILIWSRRTGAHKGQVITFQPKGGELDDSGEGGCTIDKEGAYQTERYPGATPSSEGRAP